MFPRILLLFFLLFILSFSLFCSPPQTIHKIKKPLLGTIIEITAFCDSKHFSKVTPKIFKEIARIESLMSPFKKESGLYKINHSAFSQPLKIDPETFNLLETSNHLSRRTEGYFDISFAPLKKFWDYKHKNFAPPSQKQLNEILPLVNYQNIILNSTSRSIFFKKKGMQIDLGGIAKGYALKKGIETMKKNGLTNGIVNAGGDLQVIGQKNDQPWLTGLQHPRLKKILLSIKLKPNDSIATSGDYERYTIYKNQRYHHLLNPHSGYPAQTFSSVSVISKDPVLSDAYATAFFIMGLKKTTLFLAKNKDLSLQVILTDQNLNLYISREIKSRIKILEPINSVNDI